MTAPTPEQRAAWRSWCLTGDGENPMQADVVLALLDALDAVEAKAGNIAGGLTSLWVNAEGALARVEALSASLRPDLRYFGHEIGEEIRAALNPDA